MGWVLPTIAFFLGVAAIITYAIFKIKEPSFKTGISIPENAPIVDVGYRRRFTDGYDVGLVISQEPCRNGTTRVTFVPTDTDQSGNEVHAPPQTIIVANEFVKRIPRGSGSARRERIKIIDRFKSQLPEELRDTPLGYDMSAEGQRAFLLQSVNKWQEGGDDVILNFVQSNTSQGIATAELKRFEELGEEIVRKRLLDVGDGKPS